MPIIKDKIGLSYNDLTLVPTAISEISSRKECNVFLPADSDYHLPEKYSQYLPIFTAPMSSVVNTQNMDIWYQNNIMPIIPRNIPFEQRYSLLLKHHWIAYSLKEFTTLFIDTDYANNLAEYEGKTFRVCVDLANGHMKSLYDSINKAKEISRKYKFKLLIMTGNIANPKTYEWICKNAEVDYIRCGIGGGAGCLTSTLVGVHYPMASLIDECYKVKKGLHLYKSLPAIVADGGVRGPADIIKALALGADYVMIGGMLSGLFESAADTTIESYNSHYKYTCINGVINNGIEDIIDIWKDNSDNEQKKRQFIKDMKSLTKEFYGMSTKKAQKLIDKNAKLKTSEGCTKYMQVKHTVNQQIENIIDEIKSAMSYTSCKTLEDFIGNVTLIQNSQREIMAVNQ